MISSSKLLLFGVDRQTMPEQKKQEEVPTRYERQSTGTGGGHAADLVHPANEGFKEKITPKPLNDQVLMFTCPCGACHFRHAGYVKMLLPFLKPKGVQSMVVENYQVMVCVACKKSFVWADEQMWDVTEKIDLKAWEKAERELQQATGPGGQC